MPEQNTGKRQDKLNSLYVATFSEGALDAIREHKLNIEFDHLCISENLDRPEQTLQEMKEDFRTSGAKAAIVHGPYTELNASSVDPKAAALTMERYHQTYKVCRELGIQRMILHSGYIPILYYKEWHIEKSVDFWKRFIQDKEENFHLYIENVFEDEPYCLKEILEGIHDSRVGLCLDVGHVNASSDPKYDVYHWIEVLSPWIGHVHLHNNNGIKDEHAPIYQGTMDMKMVLAHIKRHCGRDVTYTIESRTCAESIRWLKEQKVLLL